MNVSVRQAFIVALAPLFLALSPTVPASVMGEDGILISPDGEWLAYSRRPTNEALTQIVIARSDGSEARTLCQLAEDNVGVLWFDQRRIAVSRRDQPGYRLFDMKSGASSEILLPNECDIIYKRLSPDRKHVAFVGTFGYDTEKAHGLFVVQLGTGATVNVMPGAYKTAPAWSPDSRYLAVGSGESYIRDHLLVIYDTVLHEKKVLDVEGSGAAWSPGGESIACTTDVSSAGSWYAGIPVSGRTGVYDLGSGTMTPLGEEGWLEYRDGAREQSGAFNPVWSPDGRWVAFRQRTAFKDAKGAEESTSEELWLSSREGGEAKFVAEDLKRIAWAPGGEALYILFEDRIARYDLRTGRSHDLVRFEGNE